MVCLYFYIIKSQVVAPSSELSDVGWHSTQWGRDPLHKQAKEEKSIIEVPRDHVGGFNLHLFLPEKTRGGKTNQTPAESHLNSKWTLSSIWKLTRTFWIYFLKLLQASTSTEAGDGGGKEREGTKRRVLPRISQLLVASGILWLVAADRQFLHLHRAAFPLCLHLCMVLPFCVTVLNFLFF